MYLRKFLYYFGVSKEVKKMVWRWYSLVSVSSETHLWLRLIEILSYSRIHCLYLALTLQLQFYVINLPLLSPTTWAQHQALHLKDTLLSLKVLHVVSLSACMFYHHLNSPFCKALKFWLASLIFCFITSSSSS